MTIITPKTEILKNATGRALFARALEPRFMLDGAAAATVVEATPVPDAPAGEAGQGESQALVDSLAPAADTSESSAKDCCNEIAFVDAGVENYEALVAGLPNGVEVIVLDANSDGIAQISAALEGRTGIEAIHILSHGNDGTAVLGNTVLSNDTIGDYATQIASWADSLTGEADILFYGCNIAAGDGGEALVAELAQLSGADIAASTDITGAADQGGNWVLEHNTGVIEAANTITAASMAAFNGSLVTIDLFDFNQEVDTRAGTPGVPTTSTVTNAATIFGDEREVTITDTGGAASTFEVNPAGVFAGSSSFTNDVGAMSTAVILYDGVGTGGFDATDFTHDGTSTGVHDRFLFNIRLADVASTLDIRITSSGGGVSTSTGNAIPVTGFGNTPFAVLYSSFVGTGTLTDVTSIQFTFTATVAALDLVIDFVSTNDTTTIPPGPPPAPDPPGTNPPPTPDPPADDPPPASPPPTSDNPVLNFEQQNPQGGDSDSRFPPIATRDLSNPVPDYGTIGLHVGHSVNGRDASIHAQYDGNTTDIKSGIGSGEEFSLKNAVTGNQDANVNDAAFGTGGFGDSANPSGGGERVGETSSGALGAALSNLTPGAGGNFGGPTSDSGQMLNPAQESFFLNVGDGFSPLQGNDNSGATPVFSFGDGQIRQQNGGTPGDVASNNTPNAGTGLAGPVSLADVNAAFDNLAPTPGSNAGPQDRFGFSPNGQIDRQQGSTNGNDGLFGALDPVNRPERELLNPEEEEFFLGLGNGLQRQLGEENQPPRPNERFFLFENGAIEGQPNDSGQEWSPPENNLDRDVDGNPQPQIGDGQLTSLEAESEQPAAIAFDLQGVPGLTAQLDTVANAFDDRRADLLASLVPAEAESVKQAA